VGVLHSNYVNNNFLATLTFDQFKLHAFPMPEDEGFFHLFQQAGVCLKKTSLRTILPVLVIGD
jgi:hypothetical protein